MSEQHLPMNEARVAAILDAYGGKPEAWPMEERDNALKLIALSQALQDLQQQALRLDAALVESAVIQKPNPENAVLAERILSNLPLQVPVAPQAKILNLLSSLKEMMTIPVLSAGAMAALVALVVYLQPYAPMPSGEESAVQVAENWDSFDRWAWEETGGQVFNATDEEELDFLGLAELGTNDV